MTSTLPRYLFLPSGTLEESVRVGLASLGPLREVRSRDELVAGDGTSSGEGAGWVLIPPGCDPASIVELLVGLASAQGIWSPLLVVERSDGIGLIPLSAGMVYPLSEVSERLTGGKGGAWHLSLRVALDEAARARHDINNPLTAAMAELQLLAMDVEPESEVGTTLHRVEELLRRIRDLVAKLGAGRPQSR